ncbi:hypothetical protein MP228_003564 [Amoeboaphelidium protococcarum]|nr:hypothetical protein MP228_003564 [Amoeboaphelidium protococcarum]
MPDQCDHPVQFHGLCAVCGQEVRELDQLTSDKSEYETFAMVPTHRDIKVTKNEAQKIERQIAQRLMEEKKLSLILDLDQTVLHASVNQRIGEVIHNDPTVQQWGVTKDVHSFTLPHDPRLRYYVKLRPGLYEFLKDMSKLYEFHIYTMGTRSYAEAVRLIIDPRNELFKERILTRDESGSNISKDIKNIFPCDSSMVLILDDRSDVWNWSDNLIKVKPYTFFYGTEDINAPGQQTPDSKADKVLPPYVSDSSNESNDVPANARMSSEDLSGRQMQDTSIPSQNMRLSSGKAPFPNIDADTELFQLKDILSFVHSQFFSESSSATDAQVGHQRNAAQILKERKIQVLGGVSACFSAVFPTSLNDGTAVDVTKYHDWKLFSSYGAVLRSDFSMTNITHLVAANPGTVKVETVRKQNKSAKPEDKIWIVTPQYFHDCISTWQRLSELDYLAIQNDQLCIGRPLNLTDSASIPQKSQSAYNENDGNQEVNQSLQNEGDESVLDDDYILDEDALNDLEQELLDELESTTGSQMDEEPVQKDGSESFNADIHDQDEEDQIRPKRKKAKRASDSPSRELRSRSNSPSKRMRKQ